MLIGFYRTQENSQSAGSLIVLLCARSSEDPGREKRKVSYLIIHLTEKVFITKLRTKIFKFLFLRTMSVFSTVHVLRH